MVTKRDVPSEFDRVARSYDLLTALNPGYRKHLRWSAERLGLDRRAAEQLRLLDLCCGTGLSTLALAKVYPGARIVALDASAEMLEIARRREYPASVETVLGDATVPSAAGVRGPFDGVLIAYGVRNVPDLDKCLEEIHTLLAPGGVLAVHEYSVADSRVARAVWNAVSSAVIVPTGSLVSRRPDIYRYLKKSVNEFDGARAFQERLLRAGFVDVSIQPMDGWQRGIVHTFVAKKPDGDVTTHVRSKRLD